MMLIREYLLKLTAAALFCSVVVGFVGDKGALGKLIKLITGIFMMVTIAAPIGTLHLDGWTDYIDKLTLQTSGAVQEGEDFAKDTLVGIIKEETRSYILDKAKAYDAQLEVEVDVDDSTVPVPRAVLIRGSISPYGRQQLQRIIQEDLGIKLEAQEWISG